MSENENYVHKIRKTMGMTQEEFMKVMDVRSKTRVSQVETSRRQPSLQWLVNIDRYCKANGIPLDLGFLFEEGN